MAASTWSTTDKTASITLSGSNLIATSSTGTQGVRGKDPKRTGKFYFELKPTVWVNNGTAPGLCNASAALSETSTLCAVYLPKNGTIFLQGVSTALSLGARAANDIIGIAVDLDARLVWFRVAPAGNWNGSASADPATGIGGVDLSAAGIGAGIDAYPLAWANANLESITANFGGTAFSGTVPTGYTSGWDDTVSALSNAVVTQLGAEAWATTSPAVNVTQIGVEAWYAPNPQYQLTQAGQEVWAVGSPAYQVTQVGLEVWASIANVTTVALTGRVRGGDMTRGAPLVTGTPIIGVVGTLTPTGIASGEALGVPTLVPAAVTLTLTGLASGEALGTPTLAPAGAPLAVSGIASGEALGGPTLTVGATTLTPAGIASGEALGATTLVPGAVTLSLTGIASGELLGAPALVPILAPDGIPSGEALGTPTLVAIPLLLPAGIASGEALGTPMLVPGPTTLHPTGIASGLVLGATTVHPGPATMRPAGIASANLMGATRILPQSIPIAMTGIPSTTLLGTVTMIPRPPRHVFHNVF